MREDILWLLRTIQACVEECSRRKWGSCSHYIFRGSYDVWETADDGVKYDNIKRHQLNEAMDLGLISNESGKRDWKWNENWILTDLGEEVLSAHRVQAW
jgi:hypothetical protein